MILRHVLLLITAMSFSCSAGPEQPVEVGKVQWGRDLDAALSASKSSGKPVFALFQEVPGCSGCKQFGKDVLSEPLVVDAIENEFVPLLIHNNEGGKDAQVLKRFNEPAWNYQVVRFLNAKGEDVIPRKDRVWTTAPLVDRMIRSLDKARRPIPRYLPEEDLKSAPDSRLQVANLTGYRSAPASDQKKQLSGTNHAKLGLTAGQSTKLNAWLHTNPKLAAKYLSPPQRDAFKR